MFLALRYLSLSIADPDFFWTPFASAYIPGWHIFLNSRKDRLFGLLPVHIYWICIWVRLRKAALEEV